MTVAGAIIDAGRARAAGRARDLLCRGGARIAQLDQRPAPHRLIMLALPLALSQRFDPESARDLEAVLELRVRQPGGGPADVFELRVSVGTLAVRPGPARDPRAGVELGADDMLRLVSGAVGWPQLLASGQLELSGDPFLALRFPNLFRLPASAA